MSGVVFNTGWGHIIFYMNNIIAGMFRLIIFIIFLQESSLTCSGWSLFIILIIFLQESSLTCSGWALFIILIIFLQESSLPFFG